MQILHYNDANYALVINNKLFFQQHKSLHLLIIFY